MNIVDPILFQCKLNPAGAAICVPGTKLNVVSYGRLERFIHNVSRMGHAHGLGRGQIVAISVNDTILHAALILGLTRLGIVTLSLSQPAIPGMLSVDAVLSDSAIPIVGAKKVVPIDDTWLAGDGKPMEDHGVYCGDDEDLCRILLTSGSTSEAKAMALTHRNMRARAARHDFAVGNRFPHCARLYFAQSIESASGMRYLAAMLSRGGTIFFYGRTPEETIQSFELYKVQGMIATPATLAYFAQFYEASFVLQSGLEFIVTNGGRVTQILSERVRTRMCANLFSSYGTTETGTAALASASMLAANPGAAGLVVPDVQVEVVDESDEVLPPDREGLVRICSPYMPGEYLGNAHASATAFRSGWFYPGDIGRVTSEGLLYVTGRLSNTLHIGGHKVNPEHVEAVLIAAPGVEQAAAVADFDAGGAAELIALLVAPHTLDVRALEAHCAARLPQNFVPARYYRVESLPRTPEGKLARQQLLALAKQAANRN